MKKIYLLILGFIISQANSQNVFFAENFGNVSETTPILNHQFQNSNPVNYSGTADVRNSNPSTTTAYPTASGGACIFIGAADPSKVLLVEGIDTSGFTNISMSFGHYKSTNASSNELTVEVSSDGLNWTALSYTRTTGASTSSWVLVSPTGSIPSATNLRIRFTNTILAAGFRIDDLSLSGDVLSLNKNSISGLKLFPNPVNRGILNVSSNSSAIKEILFYDVLGKLVYKTKTFQSVNTSSLHAGIYMVKVIEDGKSDTRKVVVN